MLYAYEQEVPIDDMTYERVIRRIGVEPLAGQLVHLALRSQQGSLRFIEVWNSREDYERAATERIRPAMLEVLKELGAGPVEDTTRHELSVLHLMTGSDDSL